VDFRGKPAPDTDLNFLLYGVNDRGFKNPDGTRGPPQGGVLMTLTGRSNDLGWGFRARGQMNYLSSFTFRQAFTESFFEAIFSEVHSLGHVSRYWDTYALNFVASRIETFQWPTAQTYPFASGETNKLSLRRLPSAEFNSRDRQITEKVLPVWISWTSSASFLRRHELDFTTRQFVDRLDAEPRIMTALHWKGFNLTPALSMRQTRYGSSRDSEGRITGAGFLRSAREVSADITMPSLSRVFDQPPRWLGEKVKHVIEPRASFRYVGGIGEGFHRLLRFDETELLADTKEFDFTLTNRFYSKAAKTGAVTEVLTWDLTQRRYLDPTFGGALLEGRRNVLLSSATLTGYAFFDAPRSYSPLISNLRATLPGAGLQLEWRTDYDPARKRIVNSTLSANARMRGYFASVGHNQVRSAGPRIRGATDRAHTIGQSDLRHLRFRAGKPPRMEHRQHGSVRLRQVRVDLQPVPGDLQHRLLRMERPVPPSGSRHSKRKSIPGGVRGGEHRLLRHFATAGAIILSHCGSNHFLRDLFVFIRVHSWLNLRRHHIE
jgi:LPS-assembly protein